MLHKFDLMSYSSLDWRGRRILMRVDCNVSFSEDGKISDDFRIRSLLSTLRLFLKNGCSLVLISHLASKNAKSLKKCAACLQNHLQQEVVFVPHQDNLAQQVQAVPKAPLVLLENLRLHPGEVNNDPHFAQILSLLGEIFINEAFSCSHRAHASIVSLPHYFMGRCGAGPFFLQELESLSYLMTSPLHPRCAIIGGAKLTTKIPLIKHLKAWAEEIILVGAIANSFLHVIHNASSLSEEDAPFLQEALSIIDGFPGLILPVDGVVREGSSLKVVQASQIGTGEKFLDLGPQSIAMIQKRLKDQKTIFWNGPAGLFEQKDFSIGTLSLARFVGASQAQTFVAGGDTIAAARQAKVEEQIDYLLNGGGASLTFLQEHSLPGIFALEECSKRG